MVCFEKSYTEYPTHKNELSFLKQEIIDNLKRRIRTDCSYRFADRGAPHPESNTSSHKTQPNQIPKTPEPPPKAPRTDPTPEELDQVEQTVRWCVTDTELKTFPASIIHYTK